MNTEQMLEDLKSRVANLEVDDLQSLLAALEDMTKEELIEAVYSVLDETFSETEWSNDREEKEFYSDVSNIINGMESRDDKEGT